MRDGLLARSAEHGDPLRLRHAPHTLARSVVLNPQVDGFRVVAQQCGGGLELRKTFDSGEDCDNGERDQVGEAMSIEPTWLTLHVDFHWSTGGSQHCTDGTTAFCRQSEQAPPLRND